MTPEELRRRYAPDPRRELVADLREALAGTDDPAERQALFDTANEVAGGLVADGHGLEALTGELHAAAFGPPVDTVPEGWRLLALERHPELQAVYDAVDAAGSDAERAEVVLAAISSRRFDGDDDAIRGLLALDPTIDQRLDTEDEPQADAERAEMDRRYAEAVAAEPAESPAQAMLRRHLEAAETAATEAEAVNA
jgi:hypothetical protein